MLIYTSHLSQGKRFVFKLENAIKEMHRGSFGFSEYPQGKQKNYTKERTGERFRGMMCKMGLTGLHDFYSSWHLYIRHSLLGHSTLLDLFVASLERVYEGHFMLCVKRKNLK